VPHNNNGKILAAVIAAAVVAIGVVAIITHQSDKPTATTQVTYPTTTSPAYTAPPTTTTPDYTTPDYTTPTYTTTAYVPPPPPPPPPAYWGAIAVAGNGGSGWSGTTNSLEEAKVSALAQCRSVGQNCKVVVSGQGGCFALAGSTTQYYGGYGPTQGAAEQDALNRNGGGTILSLHCI
jgi:hypothetical protein